MTQQRCYYPPLRRVRTRYSVGPKYFYCSGLQDWEARCTALQRAGVLTSVREGCVSFFSVLRNCTCTVRSSINRFCLQYYYIRTEEELRNKLRHRPQSVGYRQGDLPNALKCGSDFIGILIRGGVVRRALFSATGCEYFGVLKNLRLLKPGMSVERVIILQMPLVGFQD